MFAIKFNSLSGHPHAAPDLPATLADVAAESVHAA
jgi:hypothetical protein